MILSSDGQEADKANLLHDEVYNNIAFSIQHSLGELLEDFYRHAYPMALHVKHLYAALMAYRIQKEEQY